MKIIELRAENIKRLQAVSIAPDGSLVVIAGENEAGKTSVLDSIEYALGGTRNVCTQPIRTGAKKAEIVCDLGDIVVTRRFTAKGSSLTVKDADGKTYGSPQSVLDALTGRLSFDPLEFSRQRATEQATTLRPLLGLDFSALDAERAKAFDSRTGVNRDGKALAARVESMPHHEDAPAEELATAVLLAEIDTAAARNRSNNALRNAEILAFAMKMEGDEEVIIAENAVIDAKEALKEARKIADKASAASVAATEAAASLEDIDDTPIRVRLAGLDDENRKVRENVAHATTEKELKAARTKALALTKDIGSVDRTKAVMIEGADFPIDGLGFDDDGVTLDGLPFDQASGAQKLRVSVAIGLALNPELRVLLIRDGSLLDEANLKLVAEMAAENDAQVWIERVGTDDPSAIIIEDGMVRDAPGGAE